MEFKDRLIQALAEKDMTAADLSRLSGIGEGAISQYKSGAYKASQRNLEKIANALGVSIPWLMGYEVPGQPVKMSPQPATATTALVSFPVIGRVSAGYDGKALEEYTGAQEAIPAEDLRGRSPEDFMVLRVNGNSMYPLLLDGDRILVERTTSVDSGSLAVILYAGEEATVKRVRYVYGEDWLELIPQNPEYQTKRIEGPDLEECRVLGKVLKLIRTLE